MLQMASAFSALPTGTSRAQGRPNRTRWKVRASEGFDAIAFLGPLSATPLYLDFYGDDVAAFSSRLPAAVRADAVQLWHDANKDGFGLLGPNLQVLFSATCSAFLLLASEAWTRRRADPWRLLKEGWRARVRAMRECRSAMQPHRPVR